MSELRLVWNRLRNHDLRFHGKTICVVRDGKGGRTLRHLVLRIVVLLNEHFCLLWFNFSARIIINLLRKRLLNQGVPSQLKKSN
jgi:hypothetical protein